MYGFNQIESDSFIVGSELMQICLGANEIILNFFPYGTSINIFNVDSFIYHNNLILENLISINDRKINNIGSKVERLNILNNNAAILIMTDGSEIVLLDDSSDYESMTFQCSEIIIVV